MEEFEIGDEAPDFDLPGDGGQNIRLSAYRGSIVVLFFYPKDNTEGCTMEAVDFTSLQPEFDRIDSVLIGMSPDSVRRHDNFKKKHNLGIRLASDPRLTVLQRYGVWAEKTMFGRKYMGVVRSTLLIDRFGMIAKIWPNVRVAGHASDVLAAAREIA